MSEYDEPRWAVLSERGAEAENITYDQAVVLLKRLASEKVYGTCIVTAEAVRRFTAGAQADEINAGRQKRDGV